LDFKNQILPPEGNIRSDVPGIFFFVQGKTKYVDNFVCNCLSEVLYIVLSKRKIYDDTTKDVNSSTNIPVQQQNLTTPKSPLFFSISYP
jgi:hypothetical protein